jgi:hypothetical protein
MSMTLCQVILRSFSIFMRNFFTSATRGSGVSLKICRLGRSSLDLEEYGGEAISTLFLSLTDLIGAEADPCKGFEEDLLIRIDL